MSLQSTANADQIAYWNNAAGETWAALQDRLDRQIEPLGLRAIEAGAPQPGERVLDIGCGCGQTSFELARRVGPSGRVLGVDISAPMLEVARQRAAGAAANVSFIEADAQTHAFQNGGFDLAISRFGVMFFDDPTAAFRNIGAALRPGGRLSFVCWRPMLENAWMATPLFAAMPLLPPLPPPDPAAPGPFAFADPERV
ncbi:MAG: SAM-dependent methyltransferase, partial [Phenylobacterium sp.]|nr:SAM-dependent methyltransferase [Phenylobacterium sp.]